MLAPVLSMMPSCHFLLFLLSLFSFLAYCIISSISTESCYCVVFVDSSPSSLPNLNVQFTASSSNSLLLNYLNSRTSFRLTILLHSVKLHSFNFHESNTPHYFLLPQLNIHQVISRKCFLIFLQFQSGDIQPNHEPNDMSASSENFKSSLDVYEPFSSLLS